MGTDPLKTVLGHLRRALLPPDSGGLSDAQLLGCFVADRDEAAFAALVRRHGPMVLGVCRRILGNWDDADDAFQATFLVLARKAASVVKREAVAGFLYGVACRTALRAKARAQRRRATERQVEDMPHPEVPPAEAQDWRPLLDRELDLLPRHLRMAIVLCDLEGKTRREAARQLGLAEGTLSSRLARGRRLLAKRLTRSGLTLSGGALAAALAEGDASAAVPARLVVETVRAAAAVAAGQLAGPTSPAVLLMNEVLRAMLMTKLKLIAAVGFVTVLLGAGGLAYRAAGQAPAPPARVAEASPLSELDVLRREVDILKLQVELLQEKMRSQESELSKLKGQVGGKLRTGQPKKAAVPGGRPGMTYAPMTIPAANLAGPYSGSVQPPGTVPAYGPASTQPGLPSQTTAPVNPYLSLPLSPAYLDKVERPAPHRDPAQQAEQALKALRESPNDGNVRRKAVEALERALRQLKGYEPPDSGQKK
jgi:RNA polymerase sigma factor (sigma-70 family)